MVLQAEAKRTQTSEDNIIFQEADIEDTDFPNNSFDAILCASALPYIQNIEKALEKYRGWLRKSGGVLSYNSPKVRPDDQNVVRQGTQAGDLPLYSLMPLLLMPICGHMQLFKACTKTLTDLAKAGHPSLSPLQGNYTPLIPLMAELLQKRNIRGWKAPMWNMADASVHEQLLRDAGFQSFQVPESSFARKPF